VTRRVLDVADVRHIATGAMFVSCALDHETGARHRDELVRLMEERGTGPVLVSVDELDPEALTAAVGFVNNGLPISEMIPVGDEFDIAVELLQERLGVRLAGIFPLAAATVNAVVPLLTSLHTGIPVIDADPMGRVLPLVSQTTLALAGKNAGPVALTGPTGERAVIDVTDPVRTDRIERALAGEFGGWAATASYPGTARDLAEAGVLGSYSRLLEIGRILDAPRRVHDKYAALTRLLQLRKPISARVVEIEGLSRPASPEQPDRPWSVTLVEETRGRIIRLELQNEILMMLVDGAVEAIIPDIITILRAADAGLASVVDDIWVGNRLTLFSFPAAPQWYTADGLRMAGPAAMQFLAGEHRRRAR